MLGRDAGTAVAHRDHRLAARGAQAELDPRARRVAGGVHRVVEEIADDRDEAGGGQARAGEVDVVEDELDPALLGGRRLAEQQRDERRLVDALLQAAQQFLGEAGLLGRERDRLVVAPELDETDERVQPVGRLVRLRAQRVGEPADAVELADQALELGPVAQGRDGPDGPAVDARLALADDQDAVAQHV